MIGLWNETVRLVGYCGSLVNLLMNRAGKSPNTSEQELSQIRREYVHFLHPDQEILLAHSTSSSKQPKIMAALSLEAFYSASSSRPLKIMAVLSLEAFLLL